MIVDCHEIDVATSRILEVPGLLPPGKAVDKLDVQVFLICTPVISDINVRARQPHTRQAPESAWYADEIDKGIAQVT